MKKFKLKSKFSPQGDQIQAIEKISSNFKKEKKQTLLGVTGSGKTFTVANVIEKIQKNTLIIAHNKTLAAQLYAEFKEFFPENRVEYFVSYYDYYQPEAYVPSSGTYIEKDASINDNIDKLRHSTTESLISKEPVIVISSVSCIYGLGDPDEYEDQKLRISVGDQINRDDFLKKLVAIQYQRNDFDFKRGTFRVRGDIVEIFPPSEDSKVIRIEFFDEDIEAILIKDPLTGETFSSLDKIYIYPSSHYVVGEDKLKKAIKSIKKELASTLNSLQKDKKIEEYNRLKQRTSYDLEMLEEMGFCNGIENYSRHFTGLNPGEPPPTLVDFFKRDFLLVIDESHITVPQIGAMYRGDRSRKENLVNYGFRLPSALDNRPLKFDEFKEKLDKILFVSATPGEYEKENSSKIIEQITRPTGLLDPLVEILPVENQVNKSLELSKDVIKKGGRVLITTLTKKMAEELTDFYKTKGVKVGYLHSDIKTFERVEIINKLRAGEIDILVGINLLREGLDIPEISLVLILDADKEGFLRSEKSLIQTIGRAARNKEGKVYLFADKKTKSIVKALEETSRRREIQQNYNIKNNITPKSIKKEISKGILEVLSKKRKEYLYNPKKAEKEIFKLEKIMRKHAKNQNFEKAAEVRDEIKKIKEEILNLS